MVSDIFMDCQPEGAGDQNAIGKDQLQAGICHREKPRQHSDAAAGTGHLRLGQQA